MVNANIILIVEHYTREFLPKITEKLVDIFYNYHDFLRVRRKTQRRRLKRLLRLPKRKREEAEARLKRRSGQRERPATSLITWFFSTKPLTINC